MPLELKRGFSYSAALYSCLLELTLCMDNALELLLLQTSVIFLPLKYILLYIRHLKCYVTPYCTTMHDTFVSIIRM
jgi:hypothetical protein